MSADRTKLPQASVTPEREQLLEDIGRCEDAAHRLGVHVTAHALNRAKNALGWELAGDVEEAGRASRDERPERKKQHRRRKIDAR